MADTGTIISWIISWTVGAAIGGALAWIGVGLVWRLVGERVATWISVRCDPVLRQQGRELKQIERDTARIRYLRGRIREDATDGPPLTDRENFEIFNRGTAARQSGSMRLPDCLCVDDGGCLLELGDRAMAQGENLELRWTCPRCLAEWHYTATPTGLTAERL